MRFGRSLSLCMAHPTAFTRAATGLRRTDVKGVIARPAAASSALGARQRHGSCLPPHVEAFDNIRKPKVRSGGIWGVAKVSGSRLLGGRPEPLRWVPLCSCPLASSGALGLGLMMLSFSLPAPPAFANMPCCPGALASGDSGSQEPKAGDPCSC